MNLRYETLPKIFARICIILVLSAVDSGSVTVTPAGRIWICTNMGVTCYTPSPALPPPVFIDAVVADQRYTSTSGDVLPERQKGNLEKVVAAANRRLELINDLLDLSKIEAGRMDVLMKRFSVSALVRSCCAEVEPLVAEKSGVDLICEVGDDGGEAETDEGRVRQIVTNLLSNAIKFTEQGEVKVHCKILAPLVSSRLQNANSQLQNEDAGMLGSGEMIEISVEDTGSGIPSESLDTIFEEFQQVKGSDTERKGTGLGLPICKGFAELLGGSIGVASEVGKGSVFRVRIPVVYRDLS